MEYTKLQDKVSYNQVLLLIIASRIIVGLTYLPSINFGPSNQDIWIMLLL